MIALTPLDLAGAADLGDGIALRPQTDADRGFVRDLYGAQRAGELAVVPWEDAMKAAFVDQQFAAQTAHLRAHRAAADYLIVMRDAVPIGRLYVDRTVDPWRLVELGLSPAAAGRGIGAALVRWLIGQAATSGASAIDLHVANDNPRGAAFYARLGFVDAPSTFETHRRMRHDLNPS